MTGPEHYRKAEELLDRACRHDVGSDPERYALASAHVHATLALTAASVIGVLRAPAEFRAWREAVEGKEVPGA